MTDAELRGIEERNRERKKLKDTTTRGEWLYDSFAFVDTGEYLPKAKQIGILVRPRTWFEELWDQFGNDVLDRWLDHKNLQPYYDADWIVHSHNDTVERDVDALLVEVKRLRKMLRPRHTASETKSKAT
jgi:hypothetical protein